MSPPPWHITHSACQRYAFALRWPASDEDIIITRATEELTRLAGAASYRERDRYGRELWKSPKRTGGGLRWVIDPRVPAGQLPDVIWVGRGAPAGNVWAP